VAVLPEANEVDVDIKPEDLRIDIFHSGGPGGQNVNKVATAVRVVHNPSGIMVVSQDERSQLRNKTKAMAVLRSRLYEQQLREQQATTSAARRSQVGSGERSEKIRTYNFPQDRLTDHRIGMSIHGLQEIMAGQFDTLVENLLQEEQTRLLAESGEPQPSTATPPA
jgi:peptide chain release factor 1